MAEEMKAMLVDLYPLLYTQHILTLNIRNGEQTVAYLQIQQTHFYRFRHSLLNICEKNNRFFTAGFLLLLVGSRTKYIRALRVNQKTTEVIKPKQACV